MKCHVFSKKFQFSIFYIQISQFTASSLPYMCLLRLYCEYGNSKMDVSVQVFQDQKISSQTCVSTLPFHLKLRPSESGFFLYGFCFILQQSLYIEGVFDNLQVGVFASAGCYKWAFFTFWLQLQLQQFTHFLQLQLRKKSV